MTTTGIAILTRPNVVPSFMRTAVDTPACHNPDYDPDWWFPASTDQGRVRLETPTKTAAQAICHTCPLMKACAEWAIDAGIAWGVWGGLTSGQIVYRHRCRVGTCKHPEHRNRSVA